MECFTGTPAPLMIPTSSPKSSKRGVGRRSHEVEREELRRMRIGVKAYVDAELAAGWEVCPILINYIRSLESKGQFK